MSLADGTAWENEFESKKNNQRNIIKGYVKKDKDYWILDMGNNEVEVGYMLDGIGMILNTFNLDTIKENDFITVIIESQ